MKTIPDEQKNLYSTETTLLYEIRELLTEVVGLLKPSVNTNIPIEETEQPQGEIKRSELLAKVKELADKPKGWSKLSNDRLISLLKGEIQDAS